MKRSLASLSVIFVLSMAAAIDAKELKITLAGYSAGGVSNAMGQAVGAAIVKDNPGAVFSYEPGQGGANEIKVSRGETELGLSSSILMGPALNGEEPFKQKLPNLRALSFLHTNDMIMIIDGRSGLQSVEDLKTKQVRIGTHQKNSFMELGTRKFLAAYGITYEDIEKRGGKVFFGPFSRLIDQMRDRKIDAFVEPIPTPTSILIDASATIKLIVPPIAESIVKSEIEKFGFQPIVIKKETYPFMMKDLNTYGVDNILIASAEMPEDTAYSIVKSMYDHLDDLRKVGYMRQLTPEKMAMVGAGIPLHPGAQKFYKEIGVLK